MRISAWSSDVCSSDLVARHDRRMGDRQPERMAKQGGDREPIGEPAHHRGLGEAPQIAEARMRGLERARDEEQRRHPDEQPRRDHRSEERREGNESDSQCRSRGWPYHEKKKKKIN